VDIGAKDIGARFATNIRGCTDNLTRTSVILRISERTVRPGEFCYIRSAFAFEEKDMTGEVRSTIAFRFQK